MTLDKRKKRFLPGVSKTKDERLYFVRKCYG